MPYPLWNKKLVIVGLVVLVGLGVFLILRNFLPPQTIIKGDTADLTDRFNACKILPMNGELISIAQGTVGVIGTDTRVRAGVVSIAGDKVTLSISNPEANILEQKVTLGKCESFEIAGVRVYVFGIDGTNNPSNLVGRGNGSVDLFIVK